MESAHQVATRAVQAIWRHDCAETEKLYRQVIKMLSAGPSPKNPSELDIAKCFNSLAFLLEKQHRTAGAKEMKHRAVEITAKELNEMDGFDR